MPWEFPATIEHQTPTSTEPIADYPEIAQEEEDGPTTAAARAAEAKGRAITMRRAFRVGWAPQGNLIHAFAQKSNSSVILRGNESTFQLTHAQWNQTQIDRLIAQLFLHNKHAQQFFESSNQPESFFATGRPDLLSPLAAAVAEVHESSDAAHGRHTHLVFRLLYALWSSNLGPGQNEGVGEPEILARRAALSQWLEDALEMELSSRLADLEGRKDSASKEMRIFWLAASAQTDQAVNEAFEIGDFRLATLLAQRDGAQSFNPLAAAREASDAELRGQNSSFGPVGQAARQIELLFSFDSFHHQKFKKRMASLRRLDNFFQRASTIVSTPCRRYFLVQ
jgi:hypothetical protein